MTVKKVIVSPDVDTLSPVPDEITLSSGTVVCVERLKTRQLFRLLKIVTAGAGPLLSSMSFSLDDSEAFAGQLIGLIIASVPEAEDEAIEFIQGMVTPLGVIEKPRSKADKEANTELISQLAETLENPEIDDLITILETIVRNEADDIQALGKRLAAMFKMNLASAAVNSSSLKS